MVAQGRGGRPSCTYHAWSTNGMEAGRRADMESTVILSRSPFENVVFEDKREGKGE